MITIQMVNDADEKSRICNQILRGLPKWFGMEAGIVDYVEQVKKLPLFAAYEKSEAVGFLAVKEHNSYTAELCVMGVREDRHRQGIGHALVERAERYCMEKQYWFFTVKTLDSSAHSEGYARTRAFYHAMGFRPLEMLPLYWDEVNPCLFMAKSLK